MAMSLCHRENTLKIADTNIHRNRLKVENKNMIKAHDDHVQSAK